MCTFGSMRWRVLSAATLCLGMLSVASSSVIPLAVLDTNLALPKLLDHLDTGVLTLRLLYNKVLLLNVNQAGSISADFEISSHGLEFESRFKRRAYESVVAEVSARRRAGPISLRSTMDHTQRILGICRDLRFAPLQDIVNQTRES